MPEKPRIKLGQGLCGTAALLKEPVLVGDVTKDPRYVKLIEETRSELVVRSSTRTGRSASSTWSRPPTTASPTSTSRS
jgi:putative methionine-R-sulfoxide reductase with GAF domain